jgi:Rad3-related DNA helicase
MEGKTPMGDTPTATIVEYKPKKNFNDNYSKDIRGHFPFPTIRPTQETGLQAIERAIKEHKKFVIMELPTGVGKTGIGVAAGSHAKTLPTSGGDIEPGAYYCSPQKSLTAQAMRDFKNQGLVELMGRSNYTCGYHFSEEEGGGEMSCEETDFFYPDHAEPGGCHGYKTAKKIFCDTPLGITNFAYYLAESNFIGQLKNRKMLILDECHGTEEQILGLANIEITRWRCEEVGLNFMDVPYIKADAIGMGEALDWLNETFKPHAIKRIQDLSIEAEEKRDAGMKKEASKLMKKKGGLERFLQSLDLFLKSEDRKDWMVWSESEVVKCPRCGAKLRPGTTTCWKRECGSKIPERPAKLIVKPLTATLFANKLLFSKADIVVLMSATILDFDTFMRNLGIDKKDAVCVALPSEFPVENRRILYKPVANMGNKEIDKSLPLVCAEVEKLLRKHANEKGIIHTHTYKITKYVVDYLRRRGFGSRILTHEEGVAGDRERIIQEHIDRVGEPTIIISPSMTEGLDLKDDLSRFSIVMKVPYPFLSNYVKARMARDADWYAWRTALPLEQGTGRSVRHKDDKATSYILDAGFGWFIQKNGKMFSPWWAESVFFPKEYVEDW